MTDAPHDAAADEPITDPGEIATDPGETAPVADVDLDAVERDLAAVEVALGRLADGTYWTDEVTGGPIPEHVLVHNPLARRA
ncbi:MAG TPA: hypothetical protein VK860_10950 [Ilumatobacteraceae bacterium]|nr:hypothetical protein [Ilumatobacteraceae bacterium]